MSPETKAVRRAIAVSGYLEQFYEFGSAAIRKEISYNESSQTTTVTMSPVGNLPP